MSMVVIGAVSSPFVATVGVMLAHRKVTQSLNEAFPPENVHPFAGLKVGDSIGQNHPETGRPLRLVGFTGHSTDVFERNKTGTGAIDMSGHPLYYTTELVVPTEYAAMAHKGNNKGAVGAVVAQEMPTRADHGSSRFDNGYDPLSTEGQKRAGVLVVSPHIYTQEQDHTFSAAFKRAAGHSRRSGLIATMGRLFGTQR